MKLALITTALLATGRAQAASIGSISEGHEGFSPSGYAEFSKRAPDIFSAVLHDFFSSVSSKSPEPTVTQPDKKPPSSTTAPSTHGSAAGCPGFRIFVMRGTGDSTGNGRIDTLDLPLARAVIAAIPEAKGDYDLLSYPATEAFDSSSSAGASALIADVGSFVQKCGSDTPIVLFGYSQGCMAIQKAVGSSAWPSGAKVVAAVQQANPYYQGGNKLPQCDGDGPGLAVATMAVPPLPGWFRDVLVEACLRDDAVCDVGVTATLAVHVSYNGTPCAKAAEQHATQAVRQAVGNK